MTALDTETVHAAQHAARTAAETAGVVCTEAHGPQQLRAVSALFDHVWGRSAEAGAVLVAEALAAIAHAGGQVTAAHRDGELVGATAAFIGRDDHGHTFLHSHVTGVRDDVTARGIGAALKWHQRAWCLARGLTEVRWTFDPLIRRNLVFNLVRLGAQVDHYLEDAYGPMEDERNRGLPTDRLVARWELTSRRVETAASGRTASPDIGALQRAGAAIVLDVDEDGSPRHSPTEAPRQLLRVPEDIEGLRATDGELAAAWADAIRATLGAALLRGARVSGATRDGWLALATPGGVTELAR